MAKRLSFRTVFQKLNTEKGRSLPAALIALAVGSILLAPFLSFVSSRSLGSRAAQETLNDQYASDAGVEFGFWTVLNNSAARTQADSRPGTDFLVPFPEPVNDITPTVSLTAVPIGEWFSAPNVSRPIEAGGALEFVGGNTLYALAGDDFLSSFRRYTVGGNWSSRSSLPGLLFSDGCDLVSTRNNFLYALGPAIIPFPGIGRQFYRYNISNDNWTRLDNTPEMIGDGGSLVYIGGDYKDYIYALGGSERYFWRYNIPAERWEPDIVSNIPASVFPASVGSGASLVSVEYNDVNYIYAFPGGSSSNFLRYDIEDNSWTRLSNAPGGVGPGGSLAYNGSDYIYALQGNSSNFWRYTISLNSWGVLADSPNPISAGGDLAFVDGDSGYALRGGNTAGYWEFLITPPRYDVESQAGSVTTTSRIEIDGGSHTILFWDID